MALRKKQGVTEEDLFKLELAQELELFRLERTVFIYLYFLTSYTFFFVYFFILVQIDGTFSYHIDTRRW